MRHVKRSSTNIQKQYNMFKLYKLQGQITPEFLGLRMPNFQGIVFTLTETCRGVFKSALVYL